MKTTTKFLLSILAFTFISVGAKASAAVEKEWTFLLFLNGHNNLSSYGYMNLKDMEKTGSTDQLNMVVEWGKEGDENTDRLLVKKSTDPTRVTSPVIMSLKNHDMGDYHNLVDFVKWGVEKFPAKHYFVAVWNHGSGWHFQDARGGNFFHPTDISFDDNSGNNITTEQLGIAMKEISQFIGRKIDIYGSDACLMQMIEVAAEMKDSVNYMVGSQDTEPGEGWPYETFIKGWAAKPTMTPAEVGALLSKDYVKAYSGGVYGTKDVTFAAMDVTKLDTLMASTKKLAASLSAMDAASMAKIRTAMSSVQDFYYSDYKDYGSFLKVIESLPIQKDMKLISQVKSDLQASVVATDSSAYFKNATGLSIWIPNYSSSDMGRYTGLVFDKETQWSVFLNKVLK